MGMSSHGSANSKICLRRIAKIVITCGVLAGCASLVASDPDALLTSGHRSEEYCSADPLQVVQDRVHQYLQRCYRAYTYTTTSQPMTGMMVASTHRMDWQVQQRSLEGDGKQFSVRFQLGFTVGVTVKPTSNCAAAVQVFAANVGQKTRFEPMLAAARGETPACLFP